MLQRVRFVCICVPVQQFNSVLVRFVCSCVHAQRMYSVLDVVRHGQGQIRGGCAVFPLSDTLIPFIAVHAHTCECVFESGAEAGLSRARFEYSTSAVPVT